MRQESGRAAAVAPTLLASTVLAVCGAPGAVWAQATASQQVEEIVVTATREGATALQKTPMAVAAFSGDQLERSGVVGVSGLVQYAPSLNYTSNPQGGQIYIRGIGSNNVFAGSDPDATMQIDGVYIARPYAQLSDFLDVGQVEVLRGPQGTLYGRNAVAGVINIASKRPTDHFSGELAETVGDYSLTQTQAYVSGPIVQGKIDGSIALNYVNHGPYLKNVVAGSPGLDDADHGGVRAQVLWRASDSVEAITRLDVSHWEEHSSGLDKTLTPASASALATSLIGHPFEVASDPPNRVNRTVAGVSEDVNLTLSPTLSLKSITAYRYSQFNNRLDADGTEKFLVLSHPRDIARDFSQEVDLQGHFQSLDFVSGLYYFLERDAGVQTNYQPPSVVTPAPAAVVLQATPDARTTSMAVFAQADYHVLSNVTLTVGGRYTSEIKELAQTQGRYAYAPPPTLGPLVGTLFVADQTEHFDAFTPKGVVSWQATANALAYVSISQGFKSGGNNATATGLIGFSYRPEKITSYEGGLKSDWLQHRLRVNLTGFRYDYTDLQVQSFVQTGILSIGNAANARVQGLELETTASPLPGLRLGANASYLDATYLSFPTASVSPGILPYVATSPRYNPATHAYNAAGNRLNAAPKYSYSLSAQYEHAVPQGSAYLRAEYYWQDRVYFDPTNIAPLSQAPYGLVNLRLGYASPGKEWAAEFAVSNLANQGYVTGGMMEPYGWAVGYPGTPRTLSLRLSRRW